MTDDHVYSENEVIEIIEHAIRHQESERNRGPERGLSLGEIERLGEEVGIRPEHLRRAAAQVDLARSPASRGLGTEGSEAQAQRWIPGRLSQEQIEDVFAALKKHLGTSYAWGSGSGDPIRRMGRTHEWTHTSVHSQTHVTLTDHGDGYTLRVIRPQYEGSVAFASVLGLPIAFVLGVVPVALAAEMLGPLWAVVVAIAVYACSMALAHRTLTRSRARVREKVEVLADEAERVLLADTNPSDAALPGLAERSEEASAPLLDSDALASETDVASEKDETARSGQASRRSVR